MRTQWQGSPGLCPLLAKAGGTLVYLCTLPRWREAKRDLQKVLECHGRKGKSRSQKLPWGAATCTALSRRPVLREERCAVTPLRSTSPASLATLHMPLVLSSVCGSVMSVSPHPRAAHHIKSHTCP